MHVPLGKAGRRGRPVEGWRVGAASGCLPPASQGGGGGGSQCQRSLLEVICLRSSRSDLLEPAPAVSGARPSGGAGAGWSGALR
eukprot:277378-Alexandrium_andersonii.AAC.1